MEKWQIVSIIFVLIFGVFFIAWTIHDINIADLRTQAFSHIDDPNWLNANGECMAKVGDECYSWKFGNKYSYGILTIKKGV